MNQLKFAPDFNLVTVGVFVALLFLAPFAIALMSVPIHGKVTSFQNGVYTIETKEAIVKIPRSKISFSLDQKLNKNIRSTVQLNLPPSVVSYEKKQQHGRRPASVPPATDCNPSTTSSTKEVINEIQK